jgi:hypothetical protein
MMKISSVLSLEQGITTSRTELVLSLTYLKMGLTLTKTVLLYALIQQLQKSGSLRKWER